mmetsp:Transcript_20531/g.38760  ORF Transcript_20531/g.38760 Transcript_20531/m.38760 type:complete len:1084 (-) Transcript_20531:862-4113(-)
MKVTILYGSATGNAEHIAKDLAKSINESKIPNTSFRSADTMELNHFKRKKLMESWIQPPTIDDDDAIKDTKKHAVIIVCSTTGNGDAPENAGRFVRYLKKPAPATLKAPNPAAPLEHVAYAVLGLGDTNYDQFCESAKIIDKKLNDWGAQRGVKLTCADEATGLEGTVEPWLDSVLGGLEKACRGEGGNNEEEENALSKEAEEKLKISAKEKEIPQSTTPAKSTNSASSSPDKSSTPLFILYGSATGNAEHIAKDLANTYNSYLKNPSFLGYFTSVVCCELNQYKKKCLDQWAKPAFEGNDSVKHGVVVVCSTTGNADAPENADRFVRWMKRKTTEPQKPFQHCAYAVLGLGDTNYDVFCAIANMIDKRLGQLGGTRAMKAAMADEATGLEQTVEPWVGSVIGKLAVVCKGEGGTEEKSSAVVETAAVTTASESAPAVITTPVPKKIAKQSSPSGEEKKMEVEETISALTPTTNVGVSTIRQLLSLSASTPLPSISNSNLPTMVSSLSSCQLISEDMQRERPRGNSLADNMTVSSGSSGFLYTANNPYESAVLEARYLTGTEAECAANAATVLGEDYENDEKLMGAMRLYEERFPLSPPSNSMTGTVETRSGDERLQHDKNGKRVMELTLSLPDDFTLEYEPGDSVGLIVPNSPHSVQFVLSMLQQNHGILPSQKISVDAGHPITVEEAIRSTVDLCCTMKRKRLLLLSMYASDPEEENALRLLSSSNNVKEGDNVDLFQTYVEEQHRTVVDILMEFPSCQSITLEGLLGCLPAIPPRYYSVCSSPLDNQQAQGGDAGASDFNLKVAFSVVDYLTPRVPEDANSGRRMAGLATRRLECVCSSLLSNNRLALSPKPKVQIFPKPSHEFRLPSNMSTPLVLIGPGTGIAPFIGFLSHRRAQMASLESTQAAEQTSEGTWRGGYELEPADLALSTGDARGLNLAVDYMSKHQKVGDIDLFFGCRSPDHDFLYEKELEEFKESGILTNLYAAFSREHGKEKTYVQTLMRNETQCGKRLVEMILEKKASIYICGDGNAMGKDVQEAIVTLLAQHFCGEGVSPEVAKARAVAHVDQMKSIGRFVLDIWS